MKNITDLQRKLDKLIKEPANPQLYNEIGVFLYQIRDLANAELYLGMAYELCPKDLDILYNYALLLCTQFRWQEAVRIYQAYLELEPNNDKIRSKLRDLYYQLGNYLEAARYGSIIGKEIYYDQK